MGKISTEEDQGNITPSLRASAIQEGAVAVLEKGSLNAEEMMMLLQTAAMLGPKIRN